MADYSISQIDSHTYRIDEEGVRFFLLEGNEKAVLIDSGMMVHNAKEIAQTLTSLPLLLLNTHGDIDHVGSNDEFESFYMNDAEASSFRLKTAKYWISVTENLKSSLSPAIHREA